MVPRTVFTSSFRNESIDWSHDEILSPVGPKKFLSEYVGYYRESSSKPRPAYSANVNPRVVHPTA